MAKPGRVHPCWRTKAPMRKRITEEMHSEAHSTHAIGLEISFAVPLWHEGGEGRDRGGSGRPGVAVSQRVEIVVHRHHVTHGRAPARAESAPKEPLNRRDEPNT